MTGRRAASKSSERTVAVAILAIGTVASLASLLGGVWVVRAGIVVAVAMALAAFWLASRELAAMPRDADTARAIGQVADAVVIGSRLIQVIENQPHERVAAAATDFLRSIRAALDA